MKSKAILFGVLAILAGCAHRITPLPPPLPLHARNDYFLAKKLVVQERYADALRIVEDIIAAYPECVEAHRLRQVICIARGEAERMLSEYGRKALGNPKSAMWQYLYARLQLSPEEQEKGFRRAMLLDRNFAWAYYGMGGVRFNQRRFKSAAKYFRRAIALGGFVDDDAVLSLARAMLRLGRYDEVEQLCAEARKINPLDASPLLVRALAAEWREDWRTAINSCCEAVKLAGCASSVLWHHHNLLKFHGETEDLERARGIYDELTTQFPDCALLWRNLGYVLLRLGRFEDAEVCYNRAKALGLSPADYADGLRLALVAQSRFSEAVTTFLEKVPDAALRCEDNLIAERYGRLRLLASQVAREPGKRLDLAEAMASVGWIDEAAFLCETMAKDFKPAREALDRLNKHKEFRRRIRDLLWRGYVRYATKGKTDSLRATLRRINAIAREVLGRDFVGDTVTEYPFIGRVLCLDRPPSAGLLKYFYEHGEFFALWKIGSEPVEGLLATMVGFELERKAMVWGKEVKCARFLLTSAVLSSYDELLEGDRIAGRASDKGYYLNLDTIWRCVWVERRRVAELGAAISTPLLKRDRTSTFRISSLTQRLLRRYVAGRGDLRDEFLDSLDVVDKHELGHVFDARKYLPIGRHLFEALGLMLRCGFSVRRVLALAERNAQLTALAHSRAPLLAMAYTASFLASGYGGSPHCIGYHAVVHEYANLAPRRDEAPLLDGILQLSPRDIASFARQLGQRWWLY